MADEIINRHYATLLGLGTEWKVTKVELNVDGKKLNTGKAWAPRLAVPVRQQCPFLANGWRETTHILRSGSESHTDRS